MKENKQNKKNINFFFQSLLSNFIFLLNIIKIYSLCDKDSPLLKDGSCLSYCTGNEIKTGVCQIENEIIKTQWMDNTIYFSDGTHYINILNTQKDVLIVLLSEFPGSNKRYFYALDQEGRGYFNENGEQTYQKAITISSESTITRFESFSFLIKLKAKTQTKEYIMDIGSEPQLLQIYDYEQVQITTKDISRVFDKISRVHILLGAYTPLTDSSSNYYLIGLIWTDYSTGKETINLSLIKFYATKLINEITVTPTYKTFEIGKSLFVSCYEIPTSFYIVCFYKNKNKQYNMEIYKPNLTPLTSTKLQDGNSNTEIFFKCVHFYKEIGAFVYYSTGNSPYATIHFKSYCISSNTISDYYTKFKLDEYSFYYNSTLNDMIKVKDKKIFFVAVSLNKLELYIISIYMYAEEKLVQRIYKTNSFSLNEHYFYNTLRLENYRNFLVFGSNCFKDDMTLSSFNIFSYPNSTDINIDIYDSLLKNNSIKINNIKLEIKDLCKIENNIFGYILTGIKIIEITKNNGYLSFLDGTNLVTDTTIDISQILKLNIVKLDDINNLYSEFTYKIKYVCLATEPDYNEYNKYTISIKDTGGTEQTIFNSQKQTYMGRYSYHSFSLNQQLIEKGCDNKCELCIYNEEDKCVTCKYEDFEIISNYKKCNEVITTIIETTTLKVIETITPKIIEKTTQKVIETNNPTTIPEMNFIIPEKTEDMIPKIIKTTIPEEIKTISENSICSFVEIILGYCESELSDEMAQDIYLYIKKELINDKFQKENFIVKTPSVSFQLTSLDFQKNNNLNLSTVDLGECENKLREEYNISKEYRLIIFKIDIQNTNKTLTYVQYEVYHPETFIQLNLDICQNMIINITIPSNLDSETILLYQSLENQGYNMFNPNDKFYTDICTTYTTINNTDILLIDRKIDIYNKYANITICQENCNVESYNDNSNTVSCYCNAKSNNSTIDLNIQTKFNLKGLKGIFSNYLNNSNFRVMKCYPVAFDLTTIAKNIGRIVMTLIMLTFIVLFIIFIIKGNKQISRYLKSIIHIKLKNQKEKDKKNKKEKNFKEKNEKKKNKKNEEKKNIKNKKSDKLKKTDIKKSNPFKKQKTKIKESEKKPKHTKSAKSLIIQKNKEIITNSYLKQNNKSSFKKSFLNKNEKNIPKGNNIFIYNIFNKIDSKENLKLNDKANSNSTIQFNDQELNMLEYKKAIILDKRTYFQYYISLLKRKHLILFTFLPINDYNLQYIKIILFLLAFSLFFSINGFFFSDETMHQIYVSDGDSHILNQIPYIFYSSVVPAIINLILKQLSLSENSILRLKKEKNIKSVLKMEKEIKKR